VGELSMMFHGFGNSEESRNGPWWFVLPRRKLYVSKEGRTSSCAQNIKFKVDWSMNINWPGLIAKQKTMWKQIYAVLAHLVASGKQLRG